MNKKLWKRAGITFASILGGIYIVFLAIPLVINPIINGYTLQIEHEINKATGLVSDLDGVALVTTPKLTAGLKVNKFSLQEQNNSPVLKADDFQVKMSLLPLLAGKIELDAVQLKNAEINIKVNKDGSFSALENLPAGENTEGDTAPVKLPLKLSNHLPDIKIEKYNINLTDGVNNYVLSGDTTEITDFILDKSIKIKASGRAVLKGREQFNYNIKVLNKIMPELNLNDLVFAPKENQTPKEPSKPIDITGILEGLYQNKVSANAEADLVINKDNMSGYAKIDNLSIISLPPGNIYTKFKGHNIEIASDIYTAPNEASKLSGNIKTGKNPDIDLSFKSDAEIANILRIIKEIALIFDIKDLQTLSANGKINADFNIKSDLKKVKSNGYLKIPAAKLYYGLYKIGVDNINADIKLNNNNINVNNVGFSVLGHPLKFYGTVKEDGICDLHLVGEKLNLKGLLVAAGQAALLKENNVNDGSLTINAEVTGSLNKINPTLKLSLNNTDIKNIPSNTTVKIPSANINIISDGKTFSGTAESKNILAINPAATVKIPIVGVNINENEIEVTQTPVNIDKIKTNISGKIKNYLTEKITLDFVTTEDIKSTLKGDLNVSKQTLNLVYATTSPSTIVIPSFDKSKMTFSGNIGITGSFVNPLLNGNILVPSLDIPEIPVTMTELDIKLNGHILNGNGLLKKFKSGGIEAENITSDFSLKGNDFCLNNLKGTAFDGKIGGNIIYNLTNAKTTVDFSGEGLNAGKAVYGSTGIKNALSGSLNFNTKLSLSVADFEEMMRSMKGNLSFSIKNGAFGTIGRIENLLQADNIINNALLKTTVSTVANAIGMADAAKFEYIEGKLSFTNGIAELNPIKSSGPLLAYYIKGNYNLLNGMTVLTVLGRLDGTLVAKLGPIGELSADKLLGYIPKFGSLTANIVNAMTADPKAENIDAIPQLSNGSTVYKDFKVVHNGVLGQAKAIKSFKWLTDVDTSAIETKTVKETVTEIKESINKDLSDTVQSVTNAIEASKEQWNTTGEQLKNSVEELKNLFKF